MNNTTPEATTATNALQSTYEPDYNLKRAGTVLDDFPTVDQDTLSRIPVIRPS
jgi:hypothetical protein